MPRFIYPVMYMWSPTTTFWLSWIMLHKYSCTCFCVDSFLDKEITLWMAGTIGGGHRCLPGAGGWESSRSFFCSLLAAIAQSFPTVFTVMWQAWQCVRFLTLASAPPCKGPWPLTCLFCALINVLASNSILPQLPTPRPLVSLSLSLSLSRSLCLSLSLKQRSSVAFWKACLPHSMERAFSGKFINYLGHKFKNQALAVLAGQVVALLLPA